MYIVLTGHSGYSWRVDMRYLERFDTKIVAANAEDLFFLIRNFSEEHGISFTDAKDIILCSLLGSLGLENKLEEIARKLDRMA